MRATGGRGSVQSVVIMATMGIIAPWLVLLDVWNAVINGVVNVIIAKGASMESFALRLARTVKMAVTNSLGSVEKGAMLVSTGRGATNRVRRTAAVNAIRRMGHVWLGVK
jgi:hypothetical protein